MNNWSKTGILFVGTGLLMIFNLISTREAGFILMTAGLSYYLWNWEEFYKKLHTKEVIINGST